MLVPQSEKKMQDTDINKTPKNTIERLAKDCYLAAACQHVGTSAVVYEHFTIMKQFQEEHLPKNRIGLLYLKTYHKAAPANCRKYQCSPFKWIYLYLYISGSATMC